MKKIIIGLVLIAFMLSVIPVTAQDIEIPYGSISADVQFELSNTMTSAGVTAPTGMVGKTLVWELTTFDFPLDEILAQEEAPVTITGDLTGTELHVTWLREHGDAYYVQAGAKLGEDIVISIDGTDIPTDINFPTSLLDFTIPQGIGAAFPIPLLYLENMTKLFEFMEEMDNDETQNYGIGMGINQDYFDDDMGDAMAYLAGLFPTAIVPPKISLIDSSASVTSLLEYLNNTLNMDNGTFTNTIDLTNGMYVTATFTDDLGINSLTFTFNWDSAMDGILTEFTVSGVGDMDDDGTVEAWESIDIVFDYVSGYGDAAEGLPIQTGDTGSYGFSTINIDYTANGDWADFLNEEVGVETTVGDLLDTYIDLVEGLQGDSLLDYEIGSIDGLFYGLDVTLTPPNIGIGETPEMESSPPSGTIVVNGYDGSIFLNVSNMDRMMEVNSWNVNDNYDGSYTVFEWDDDIENYIGIWTRDNFNWDLDYNDQLVTALDITDFETNETAHTFTFNTTSTIGYNDDLIIVLPPIKNPIGDFNVYIPMLAMDLDMDFGDGMNVNQDIDTIEVNIPIQPQQLIPGPARTDIFFTEKGITPLNTLLQAEMVPLMAWYESTITDMASGEDGIPGFLPDQFGYNLVTEFGFDDAENTLMNSLFFSLTMAVEANDENELPKDIELNARFEAEIYEDWTDIGIFDKVGITLSAEFGTGAISAGNEPPDSTGDIEPPSPVFSPGFEVLVVLGAALTLPLIKKKVK